MQAEARSDETWASKGHPLSMLLHIFEQIANLELAAQPPQGQSLSGMALEDSSFPQPPQRLKILTVQDVYVGEVEIDRWLVRYLCDELVLNVYIYLKHSVSADGTRRFPNMNVEIWKYGDFHAANI